MITHQVITHARGAGATSDAPKSRPRRSRGDSWFSRVFGLSIFARPRAPSEHPVAGPNPKIGAHRFSAPLLVGRAAVSRAPPFSCDFGPSNFARGPAASTAHMHTHCAHAHASTCRHTRRIGERRASRVGQAAARPWVDSSSVPAPLPHQEVQGTPLAPMGRRRAAAASRAGPQPLLAEVAPWALGPGRLVQAGGRAGSAPA